MQQDSYTATAVQVTLCQSKNAYLELASVHLIIDIERKTAVPVLEILLQQQGYLRY